MEKVCLKFIITNLFLKYRYNKTVSALFSCNVTMLLNFMISKHVFV